MVRKLAASTHEDFYKSLVAKLLDKVQETSQYLAVWLQIWELLVGEQCDLAGSAAFDVPVDHVVQALQRRLQNAIGSPSAAVPNLHTARDVMEADLALAAPTLNVVVQQVMAIFEEGLLDDPDQDLTEDDAAAPAEGCPEAEEAPRHDEHQDREDEDAQCHHDGQDGADPIQHNGEDAADGDNDKEEHRRKSKTSTPTRKRRTTSTRSSTTPSSGAPSGNPLHVLILYHCCSDLCAN